MSAELKSGYVQTELGLIPKEWDVVRLGDLFIFKNGLNKSKEFFGYGTPIVNYMDVFHRPGLCNRDIQGRVDVNRNELKAYEVRKGDVFFTRTSETIEEIGVASVFLEEALDTVFSGFVLRGRPIDNSLDDAYKKYCFSTQYFRKQIISRASYTTRALTNSRSLSSSLLVRPPLAEQKRIASALSDIDALISSLDKLVAKKRDTQQAVMQQLLSGQCRLPGFSGEWEVKRLGALLKFQVGYPFDSIHFKDGLEAIRLIKNRDLKCDDQITSFIGPYDEAYVVRNGDLLIGMDGEFMPCLWNKGVALLNQRVGRIFPGKMACICFCYYVMKEPLKKIEISTGATTVKHLSHSDIENIEMPFPGLDEQIAIATILSDMDAEVTALEARRDKARQLKQGMMQELLTGRVRLQEISQ